MAFRLYTKIPGDMNKNSVFEMAEQCNFINFTDDRFCSFIHKDHEIGTEKILLLMPYENILYIERIEED